MTTKVLDNSFISACITDIKSHNIIELCGQCYKLLSSPSVYEESKQLKHQLVNGKSIGEELIEELYGKIEILDMTHDPKYKELLDYLEKRYPYLHRGELSTYLIALIHFIKGENFYFITDDMQFRKKIPILRTDKLFIKKLESEVQDINISGTIGIIRRLYEKNKITSDDIEDIIVDLHNGSFYLTSHLREYLRGTS